LASASKWHDSSSMSWLLPSKIFMYHASQPLKIILTTDSIIKQTRKPYILYQDETDVKSICWILYVFNKYAVSLKSWDSWGGIATGYVLEDWGSILCMGKSFISTPHCPNQLWGLPRFLSHGYWGHFPRGEEAMTWSWQVSSIMTWSQ
jgi:hypothetical protein